MSSANGTLTLTAYQRRLIRRTFSLAARRHAMIARLAYGRLLELDPSLRRRFPHPPAEFQRRLMQVVALVVQRLDDAEALEDLLLLLGRRHAADGIRPYHLEVLREAFTWAMRYGLSQAMTPDAAAAWDALSRLVAEMVSSHLREDAG